MNLSEKDIRAQVRQILLKELTGKYKDEVEIIYRDKNLVCMVPKSQMASHIYGRGTKWCQISKSGFDNWSKGGLLIRFLFKNGRKIRFTYFIGKYASTGFYWANESGHHILASEGAGLNPFIVNPKRHQYVRDAEKDVMNIIENDIPEECKQKVLEFIKKNQESYDYCYSDVDYKSPTIHAKEKEFKKLYDYYMDEVDNLRKDNPYLMFRIGFDRTKNEFELNHTDTFGLNNNFLSKEERFKDSKSFEKRIVELLNHYHKPVKAIAEDCQNGKKVKPK